MRFKSTQNIFKDFGEVFETKWMDSKDLQTPPTSQWDYSREMQIEDVDVWEVIWEAGGGWGVYAAWCPYAEFYLILTGNYTIETYYGANTQKKVQKRMKELDIPFSLNKVWVDPEYMNMY